MSTTKRKQKLPKSLKELQMQIAVGSLDAATIFGLLRSKRASGDIIEILHNMKCDDIYEYSSGPLPYPTPPYNEYTKQYLIVNHPNTPASVLAAMFRKICKTDPNAKRMVIGSHEVSVFTHPNFPVKLLDDILHKFRKSQFDKNYSPLFNAISSPNISAKWLRTLATHKNKFIREGVAENINTPPEILEILSTDTKTNSPREINHIPQYIAANINTPPHVLITLGASAQPSIRYRVSINPNTPTDIIKSMIIHDKAIKVRRSALYTLYKRGGVTLNEKLTAD